MSRVMWVFGWAGVGLWSLVCWAAYAAFDLLGRFLKRNADAVSSDPEIVEGVFAILNFLHGLSTSAVLFVWAVVTLLILAVPWLIDRMLAPPKGAPARPPARTPFGRPDGRVIDLGPDQYRVGAPSATTSTGPRILPRS